ncbi:MAG TPA: Na+/H+ antiporter subunit E [Candidatus Hydrogenedentes bacterium]|nr:Na+/H+ antiporter subunit E [Candidatus Hydrogenedentota bacterium]
MSRILLFIAAYGMWVLLNWVPDVQHLAAGIFVAALVALLTGDLFLERPHLLRNPIRYWYFFFYYLPVFLWECLKANIDVAYRVLHPQRPIHPGIVKIHTDLKSDAAITFLANSITLTPGTMSVDVDKANQTLYIHWIDVKAKDMESATQHIAGKFEYILKEIFE